MADLADFDPQAKARSAELRDEMKRASQEIAKGPVRMRSAECGGFAAQVKTSCARPNENADASRGRGERPKRTKDWSGKVPFRIMYLSKARQSKLRQGTRVGKSLHKNIRKTQMVLS